MNEEGYLDISDCEAATISSLLVIVFDSKKWFEESFNDKQIPQFYKEEINNFISRNQQQWDNEYKSKLYRVEEEQEDLNISQLAGKALRGNLDPKPVKQVTFGVKLNTLKNGRVQFKYF